MGVEEDSIYFLWSVGKYLAPQNFPLFVEFKGIYQEIYLKKSIHKPYKVSNASLSQIRCRTYLATCKLPTLAAKCIAL